MKPFLHPVNGISIFHWENHLPGEVVLETVDTFEFYKKSLPPGFNHLPDSYELKDVKVA